jgi:intracellular sulfur oxidation DsrE/DsrF family protein
MTRVDTFFRPTVLLSLMMATGLFVGAVGCAGPSAETRKGPSASTDSKRVVLGVRQPKHLKVAMTTAHDMLQGEGAYRAETVAIVACGPAVRSMQQDSKLAEPISKAARRGIALKACGVTVEKMGLDRDAFLESIEVVPNGFTEIVRLQSKGYHSIEL